MDNDVSDFDYDNDDKMFWSLDLSHDLAAWLKSTLNISVNSSNIYDNLDNKAFSQDIWNVIQRYNHY